MAVGENLIGLHRDPAAILRRLIRFDTTNPPGNERACIEWIADLLSAYGVQSQLFARDPARPNLVARIPGGSAPPLLLYGHVDVVTTSDQPWTRDPFAAEEEQGVIWGRGALDMKGGDAMMIAAFLRAASERTPLPGDVILCTLADEEAGAEFGAKFLVDEHPDLFSGVRYALGEFGGYRQKFMGADFYPIQVSEKTVVRLKGRLRGPGGHGAMVHRDGIMARLGRMLTTLNDNRLPPNVSPATAAMLTVLSANLPPQQQEAVAELSQPELTDAALDRLGPDGASLDAVLHDTVNVTVLRAGEKFNVVPSVIEFNLDARILPNSSPQKLIADLGNLLGPDVEFDPPQAMSDPMGDPDLAMLPLLTRILRRQDPQANPLPMLMIGATDGREFARIGIQTYGFLPMDLPSDIEIFRLIHAADERIPVSCLEFGARAIFEVLEQFGDLDSAEPG